MTPPPAAAATLAAPLLPTDSVRVAWCDLHGLLRSKRLSPQTFADVCHDGLGLVSTLALKDTADRTAYAVFGGDDPATLPPGFAGGGNLVLRPQLSRQHALPWAPGQRWCLADLHHADGRRCALDSRLALETAVAELAEKGLGLRIGLEIELHVYRLDEGAGFGLPPDAAAWPAPAPEVRLLHPGYHHLSDAYADMCSAVLDTVRDTALGLQLPLRSLEIEFGPSQFEAVFEPLDALAAADAAVLFRNGVKQALARAGYHASFMCRPPFAQVMGSGWHLHQSLYTLTKASPDVLHNGRLESITWHWLAGLLAHAPAMTALAVPTLNGYSRFRPLALAPTAVAWGRDDRSALLRVLGQGAGLRLENRLGEPAANPYLYIASQIWAGLDGLAQGLTPPAASHVQGAGEAAAALPSSLGQALDALAADKALRCGLGEALHSVYQQVKRQEIRRHGEAEDALEWERREYFARC